MLDGTTVEQRAELKDLKWVEKKVALLADSKVLHLVVPTVEL